MEAIDREMIRWDYISKSAQAGLALFLPNIGVFFTLIVISDHYGQQFKTSVGLGASLVAVLRIGTAGFVVSGVRRLTSAEVRGDVGSRRSALSSEIAAAVLAATAICVLGGLGILCLSAGGANALTVLYISCSLLAAIVAPLNFVLNALFQTLNRDRGNLLAAVYGILVKVLVASLVVLLDLPTVHAIIVLSSLTGIIACSSLVIRGRELRKLGRVNFATVREGVGAAYRNPIRYLGTLGGRVVASIDGIIFMCTFSAAIVVAAKHSVESGASIAIAVSLMRGVIVPLKQFGVVGGRFALQERNVPNRMTRTTAQASSGIVILFVISAIVVLRVTTPLLSSLSVMLVFLLCVQLLLEPFAGIYYAYRKIIESDYAGLYSLLVAYLLVSAIGLIWLASSGAGTPEAIWGTLLVARIVFAITLQFSATRSQSNKNSSDL